MASKQKTVFAILGLLAWKPMSGYDIKKFVDVGLSHFWNENYGQIYPTLDQLVKDGLATKRAEHKSGQRQRNLYTITRQGEKAFHQWIGEPTDAPAVRNELQLKFFLSSSLSKRVSVRLIEQHRAQQEAMLDEYRHSEKILRSALREGSHPVELEEILHLAGSTAKQRKKQLNIFFLTLRHGIRILEARVVWCKEAIASLNGSGEKEGN